MSWIKKTFLILFSFFALIIFCALSVLFYIGYTESNKLLYPEPFIANEQEKLILQSPEESGLSLTPIPLINNEEIPIRTFLAQKAPDEKTGTALNQRRIKKIIENRGIFKLQPNALTPRGTVIILHDWNQSLEDSLATAEILTGCGFNCIVFDARAHGERPEKSISYGETEISDIKEIIRAAQTQFKDLGPLALYGEGLGASIALIAAEQIPEIRCIVAKNAFSTLKDDIWHKLMIKNNQDKKWSGFYFLLTDQLLYWRLGTKSFNIAPIAATTRIKIPTLIISTEKNDDFYAYTAQKLYSTIASTKKSLITKLPTDDARILNDDDLISAETIEWLEQHTHEPYPDLILPKSLNPGRESL